MVGAQRRRNRAALLVGVVALATAIPLGAYAGHVLRFLEVASVDARFSVRGSRQPKDVVVVGIDDETFNDFNNFRRRTRASKPRGRFRAAITRACSTESRRATRR